MLANLLAHAVTNLSQLAFLVAFVGMREQAVSIRGVNVEEHGASQVGNVESLEQTVPIRHPVVTARVEDQGAVMASKVWSLWCSSLSGLLVLQAHASFVLV